MKKLFTLLTLFLATQFLAQSQGVQAFFSYSTFLLPSNNEPYIEVFLSFNANSLRFETKEKGNYGARVETILVFKKNDSVVFANKQEISSPEVKDPVATNFAFMNLQRAALSNGVYEMELTITDKVEKSAPVKLTEKILINYPKSQISMSDIQLIANLKKTETKNMFSKNGYDMELFTTDVVPEKMNELMYYVEIYNSNKALPTKGSFKVYSYIESYETGKKVQDLAWQKKEQPASVSYVLNGFKIDNLKKGNYNLVVEVLDDNKQLMLYKKVYFQREGSYTLRELDSIRNLNKNEFARSISDSLITFYIGALLPISYPGEQTFIKKEMETATLEEKQNFFQSFWESRNRENPEREWNQYYKRLLVVEANFSHGKRHGYVSDQGRVYLQYGPPNHIIDEKFKSTDGVRSQGQGYLPYQMWRYDILPNDKPTRMFVFWSPQIAGEYELLVSNALNEFYYEDWENRLSRGGIPEGQIGEAGRQFIRGY